MRPPPALPLFATDHLPPGTRLGLAVSGGADSIALLRLAHRLTTKQSWTLTVLHLHHGLRGAAADEDAAFVEAVANHLSLPFLVRQADTALAAQTDGLGLEEAGRLLRSGWFRELLLDGQLQAIATGHTLEDQAETVLHRLLRGGWTAGLAGIYPVVAARDLPQPRRSIALEPFGARAESTANPDSRLNGVLVRPLLGTARAALRAWLTAEAYPWREDATNSELRFTRNRVRHQLLPALAAFNPRVAEQLAQTSLLARDDERYWQAEVARLLPGLLLPGRPVRGGGRASSTLPGERSVSIEVERLAALAPALGRRLLRAAAEQLSEPLNFEQTERAFVLLASRVGSVPRREQLTDRLRVERSPRELRLIWTAERPAVPGRGPGRAISGEESVTVQVPGQGMGFGVRLTLKLAAGGDGEVPTATLRAARPADRVRLRYSSGAPKRVKEVLERMGVAPAARESWPVLEWQGELVWLRGAVLEPTPLNTRLQVTSEDWQAPEEPPPATP